MTPSVNVRFRNEDSIVVAEVGGEIDLANAEELGDALATALSNTSLGLIVDLSATSYLDSAGLRVLLDIRQRLRARQQEFRLVVPSSAIIRRLLEVSRLDISIPVDNSLEESLARVPR